MRVVASLVFIQHRILIRLQLEGNIYYLLANRKWKHGYFLT
jgi:hypothetical protein